MNDAFTTAALNRLVQRRQKAETIALQKEEAVLAQLPQLVTLRQKRNAAGMRASSLGFRGASQAEIDAALQEVAALRTQENDLLAANNISPSDLLPHYTCPLCQDTGKVNGALCSCVKALAQNLRAASINEAFPFPSYTFSSFSLDDYSNEPLPGSRKTAREQMTAVYNMCLAYAQNFDMNDTSLYLYGSAGLGKTHLALSIAGVVKAKGYVVVYVSAQNAFAAMEKERFDPQNNTLTAMLEAQLLVLDDLGTEFITPYTSACLYEIINARSVKHLPTIYTSNILSASELAHRYTEKIASRLLGECDRLYFAGNDHRLAGK